MSIEYFTYTCSCVSIDVTTVVQSSDTDANKWGLQNIEHAIKKMFFSNYLNNNVMLLSYKRQLDNL